MSHYKDLNKELVEQVQAMRISLQEHREEIISLRAKCMQQHENLVFMRKKCKDLALLNCQQYLEVLEPDSSILKHLQGQQIEVLVTPSRLQNRTENENLRQSARLTSECRRSSSLTRTRTSFNSTSPIRTSSCTEFSTEDTEGEVETEVEAVLVINNIIPEEDEPYESSGNREDEIVCTTTGTSTLCQETDDNLTDSNTEKDLENETDTPGRSTRTLREITNTLCQSNNAVYENKKNSSLNKSDQHSRSHVHVDRVTVSRGRTERKNMSNKNHNREEGERRSKSQENPSDHQRWLRNRTVPLDNSPNSMLLEDNHDTDSPEEQIEGVRNLSGRQQPNVESFYVMGNEVNASNFGLSEVSLRHFHNAPSSTPRQGQQTQNSSPPSPSNISARPKRSCRPQSLIEPTLNGKLRNETNQRSLCTDKPKSKKVKAVK